MRRLGRYGLLEPLGSGGMGTVFAGVLLGARSFRRPVAIKVLQPGLDEALVGQWLEEARIGGMLAHPNVVPTIDVGREQGQLYLVMERVDGGPVSKMVRQRPLSAAAVLDLGAQTASGLAYLHELGLVHGDIKPQNLLVDGTGLVRIVDFGVAALRGSEIQGTLNYMAPEQVEGVLVPRSDVFSLAMTLVVAATRRRFLADTPIARRRLVVRGLVGDDELWDGLDQVVPGLGPLLREASAPDPEARPGAAELAARLRGLGTSAEGEPLADRALPAARLEEDPRSGPLLGRQREATTLRQAVEAGGLVLVTGPAGSGKSRLVAEVVEAPRIGLRGVRTHEALLQRVAAVLDLALPSETPIPWWQAVLPERVVFDDADGVIHLLARVLERVSSTVVVTSRVRFDAPRVIEVGPLTEPEALDLVKRLREEPTDDLRALVASLDRLPLVLEVVAASGRASTAGIRDELKGRALEDALSLSWELLEPVEQRTLVAMAAFRGPIRLEDLQAVAGFGALAGLAGLLQHHLAQPDGDRVVLPEQVRVFADTRGEVPRRAHAERFALLGSEEALETLRRAGQGGQRFKELLREAGNLDAAVDFAVEAERSDLLGPLVRARLQLYQRLGPVEAVVQLCDRVGPVLEPADRVWLDERKAWALERQLRFTEAVELARSAHDRAETSAHAVRSDCLRREGINLARLGDYAKASEVNARAMEHARRAGDLFRLAEAQLNAGIIASAAGRRKACEHHNREAVRLARSVGYRYLEGLAMGNLAREQLNAGAFAKAYRLQARSVEVLEQVGERLALQNARAVLGAIHLERGELDEGRRWLTQVARDAARMGLRGERLRYTGMLAELEALAGRLDDAERHLDEVERAGWTESLMAVLRSYVLRKRGQAEVALALLARQSPAQPVEEAHLALETALVLLQLDRPKQAAPLARSALKTFRERARSHQVALASITLARVQRALGEPRPDLLDQAEAIVDRLEVGPLARVRQDLRDARSPP